MTPTSHRDGPCRCGRLRQVLAALEAEEQALLEDDPAYYYDKGLPRLTGDVASPPIAPMPPGGPA